MSSVFERAQGSLVLFTLFTQAAVGALWVILISDFREQRTAGRAFEPLTRIGTVVLIPLTILGFLFSTTHLGRPQFAFRAFSNLDSSWLSREVWVFTLFLALLAFYTYLWWRPKEASPRTAVGIAAGVVGLLLVVTQAKVYQVPGRPMWDHPSTTLLFLSSSFLLGPLVVAGVSHLALGRWVPAADGEPVVRNSDRRLAITLLVVVAVYTLALIWRVNYLWSGTAEAAGDPFVAGRAALGPATRLSALVLAKTLTGGAYVELLWGQVGLSLITPAVLGALLWRLHRRDVSLRQTRPLVGLGLASVTLGEIMGRALFYLTGVPWF